MCVSRHRRPTWIAGTLRTGIFVCYNLTRIGLTGTGTGLGVRGGKCSGGLVFLEKDSKKLLNPEAFFLKRLVLRFIRVTKLAQDKTLDAVLRKGMIALGLLELLELVKEGSKRLYYNHSKLEGVF